MDGSETADGERAAVHRIAAEHEAIFDRLHKIYRRLLDQPVPPFDDVVAGMKALGAELVAHFDTEEAFMRRVAYPGSEDHFSDHAHLNRLLGRLTAAADHGDYARLTEDLPLVIHAILQHLCGEDREMDGFISRGQPSEHASD